MYRYWFFVILTYIFIGCGNSGKDLSPKRLITKSYDYVSQHNAQKDPLYRYQWYLQDKTGIDIDDLWSSYLGDGVRVAVVDVGVEGDHEDLKGSIDFDHSYRFSDNSNDPSPTNYEIDDPNIDESHGTAAAGLIAASHNGVGIMGIAPNVDLAVINVFSEPSDYSFKEAVKFDDIDIFSNSWGIGLSEGFVADEVVMDAIEKKMNTNPAVYIFSAGNENKNSELSYLLNSRYTLVVGASNKEAKRSSYSNFGANLLCVAPGGEEEGLVTTDLVGEGLGYDTKYHHFDVDENAHYDYTDDYRGTSASAAIVSAVAALMKEANPSLGYRDIKYIIAHTAKKIDPLNSSWTTNGGGLSYSNEYGFGLIDAKKAVVKASCFDNLPQERVIIRSLKANESGDLSFFVDEDMVVEYVQLEIVTKKGYINDSKLSLISPDGTYSQLLQSTVESGDRVKSWEFGSMAFMDENSRGEWQVGIESGVNIKSATLKIFGHQK